jgi:hypothetical protein
MRVSLVRIAACVGLALVGACAVRAINPQPLPPGLRREEVPASASRVAVCDSGPTCGDAAAPSAGHDTPRGP